MKLGKVSSSLSLLPLEHSRVSLGPLPQLGCSHGGCTRVHLAASTPGAVFPSAEVSAAGLGLRPPTARSRRSIAQAQALGLPC